MACKDGYKGKKIDRPKVIPGKDKKPKDSGMSRVKPDKKK